RPRRGAADGPSPRKAAGSRAGAGRCPRTRASCRPPGSVERPLHQDHLDAEICEEEDEERQGEGGRVGRPGPAEEEDQDHHHEEPGEESTGERRHGRLHAVPERVPGHQPAHQQVHETESRADDGPSHPRRIQPDEADRHDNEEDDEGPHHDQTLGRAARHFFLLGSLGPRTWWMRLNVAPTKPRESNTRVNSHPVPSRPSNQMPKSVRRRIVSVYWMPTAANRRYFRSARFRSSPGSVAGLLSGSSEEPMPTPVSMARNPTKCPAGRWTLRRKGCTRRNLAGPGAAGRSWYRAAESPIYSNRVTVGWARPPAPR